MTIFKGVTLFHHPGFTLGTSIRFVRHALIGNYKNGNGIGLLDRKSRVSLRTHGINRLSISPDANVCKHIPVTIVWNPIHSKPHAQGKSPILKMAKASSHPIVIPNPKARLFDQVREVMRFHHYAIRTEQAYLQWIKRYLLFHRNGTEATTVTRGWRHSRDMGERKWPSFSPTSRPSGTWPPALKIRP